MDWYLIRALNSANVRAKIQLIIWITRNSRLDTVIMNFETGILFRIAMIADTLIIWCWAILGFFWLVNSVFTKRTIEQEGWTSRLGYGLILVVAVLLLFQIIPLSFLSIVVLPASQIRDISGLVFVIFGLMLALWARMTLGGNWSGNVTFKEDHKLIQHGPYHFVRHPIYSAILLMILGTAISLGALGCFIGVIFALVSFWVKWSQEEALMIKHFPNDYPAYKARVKAIIPFLF